MKSIIRFNSFRYHSTIPISTSIPTNSIKTGSDLRLMMRKLSHSVTIITTKNPSNHQEFHGTTISSLTSISIDPIPLISFSLRLPSRLYNLLSKNHPFNVHLLNSDHQSITLSKLFSKPRSEEEKQNLELIELCRKLNVEIGFGRLVCSIWKTIELIENEDQNQNQVKSVLILAKVIEVIELKHHQNCSKPLLYYNQTYTTIKD